MIRLLGQRAFTKAVPISRVRNASRQIHNADDGNGHESGTDGATSTEPTPPLQPERFYSLETGVATMNVQMESIRGAVYELKSEVKDLGRKMEGQFGNIDHKFEKTDAKIDHKANKTVSKVDRLLYFFIGGILLKGGFDFCMLKDAQREFEGKLASTIKGIKK